MNSKLTLRLDSKLVEQAKNYAEHQVKSLSQIVADYFMVISYQQEETPLPPITKSLKGLLTNHKIDEQDYKQHLEDKYL